VQNHYDFFSGFFCNPQSVIKSFKGFHMKAISLALAAVALAAFSATASAKICNDYTSKPHRVYQCAAPDQATKPQ
jgi:hypothetical protein